MKAKLLHLIANLFIWIAVIAGLGGFAVALALNIYTDYIPEMWHYIAIGAGMGVLILVGIILHIVANVRAKREAIRACWNVVEDADVVDAVEEEAIEEALEEAADEAVEETAEEAETEKTKIQIIREKIIEKTPLTEEQLAKAEQIGKIAVPVGAACIVLAMAAQLKGYRAGAARRRNFYKWLG
ncbi:MAG: hypothetical protein IJX80_10680 [Clostridia bacterium]|nr:hypothetical protein [Clostridia bacterium]